MQLIKDARKSGETPVLSISRDGVALGLAPWSIFEMAGVASISVLSNGKKLGAVYLAYTPQSNQEDLSRDLTSLLTEVVRACGSDLPKIVYVTDAGKIETAYWKNVLRKFFVDGVRIPIVRVVDYYHASESLTTIAEALKLDTDARSTWLSRMRKTLLEPSGHGRVLRSIAHRKANYGYKSSLAGDARKAEAYLRRYKRFMDYEGARSQGFPIGSGIVESACKQIVSERMKLAGMRWHKEGAQQVMSLRCILLSNIWSKVFDKWLQSKPTVRDLMAARALENQRPSRASLGPHPLRLMKAGVSLESGALSVSDDPFLPTSTRPHRDSETQSDRVLWNESATPSNSKVGKHDRTASRHRSRPSTKLAYRIVRHLFDRRDLECRLAGPAKNAVRKRRPVCRTMAAISTGGLRAARVDS